MCGCSLTSTLISLIHFPISNLVLPKNNSGCPFIWMAYTALHHVPLPYKNWTRRFKCRHNTPMCWLICLLCLVSSHGSVSLMDEPTEATHIDEVSSEHAIGFIHTFSISGEKQAVGSFVDISVLPDLLIPYSTHINTPPHILTYLSSSCTHTLKTPHRSLDCSSTVLYSCERISPLDFSLCFPHMNTK